MEDKDETAIDSRPDSEASKKENEHDEISKKSDNDEENEGDESASEIFEVDKILDTKMKGKKRTFYVSWKGYPESENSWEPEENLGGASEAIKEFMDEYNKKQNKKVGGKKRKNTSTESRAKSSTPASSKQKYRQDSDEESEHEEVESKDSEDDEFAPKKRGRPSKGKQVTPKSAKKEAKSAHKKSEDNVSHSRRMNQNLRWLEDDSDSDDSNAVDENEKKPEEKEVKAESTPPPALPDIPSDTTEVKPLKSKLNTKNVEHDNKTPKKEKTEKIVEESTVTDQAASSSRKSVKFVSFARTKNSSALSFIAESPKKKYTIEEAIEADAAGLARFAVGKLNNLYKEFDMD